MKKEVKELKENSNEDIKEFGTSNNLNIKTNIQFISIIGEIEGHNISGDDKKSTKYEHLIPLLIGGELDPAIEGVLIILNTVGGDIEAGLALAEMINSLSKPTVSLILGGGHSIGVPLATSTNYSFIVPTATMTIHPIRTTGLVIGADQTFRYFRKIQNRITNFILRTSNIDRDTFLKLMYDTDELANDIGTILVGKDAVKLGLIDKVGGLSDSLNKLDSIIKTNKIE